LTGRTPGVADEAEAWLNHPRRLLVGRSERTRLCRGSCTSVRCLRDIKRSAVGSLPHSGSRHTGVWAARSHNEAATVAATEPGWGICPGWARKGPFRHQGSIPDCQRTSRVVVPFTDSASSERWSGSGRQANDRRVRRWSAQGVGPACIPGVRGVQGSPRFGGGERTERCNPVCTSAVCLGLEGSERWQPK
jgi:hypothetical protein